MNNADFLWGAATSSHQIEGGNRHNDWWHWEAQGNIEGGTRSGDATNHWHRFREDLRLAKDLGLNAYRFSLEWSRIEPREGQWDPSALEWYRELVAECERLKLMPMATLLHFTIPQWLAEQGGFAWEHAPGRFAGYVRKVVSALGPRVPMWCTLNEANTMVIGSYLGAFMPPARYEPTNVAIASRNLLSAHVRAYDLLHAQTAAREGPWRDRKLEVGIAHNMVDFRPSRPSHPLERWLAHVFRRFYNGAWPDAVTGRRQKFGVLGLIPYARQVWEARGRRTVDFLGINYYTKVYVGWGPQPVEASFMKSRAFPVGVVFHKPSDELNDMGWPLHPAGLGRMIRFLGRYRLPLYVTENGIADADDSRRPRFLLSHVEELARALDGGADLRGYFHWSLLDNFEWIKGFGPRFGLYSVDYDTFARRPRGAADLYRRLIEACRDAEGGGRPSLAALAALEGAPPPVPERSEGIGADGTVSR